MAIVSHPANKNYVDNFEATFGKKEKPADVVGYPKEMPPRYNGGVLCDMWIGPCACGATHTQAEHAGESGDASR